jgi:hypothetical protein
MEELVTVMSKDGMYALMSDVRSRSLAQKCAFFQAVGDLADYFDLQRELALAVSKVTAREIKLLGRERLDNAYSYAKLVAQCRTCGTLGAAGGNQLLNSLRYEDRIVRNLAPAIHTLQSLNLVSENLLEQLKYVAKLNGKPVEELLLQTLSDPNYRYEESINGVTQVKSRKDLHHPADRHRAADGGSLLPAGAGAGPGGGTPEPAGRCLLMLHTRLICVTNYSMQGAFQ